MRPFLTLYPEADPVAVSESWQALKWSSEIAPEHLTPMWAKGNIHFYVNEIAELRDGRRVIPVRWVTRKGVVCADCMAVTYAPNVSLL